MKILKTIVVAFFCVIILGLIIFNAHLFYKPEYVNYGSQKINEDLIQQLSFLKAKLHTGSAQEMQELFPEGFVFLNSLYALSWAEVADQVDASQELYVEALREIDWTLKQLESVEGTRPFDVNMILPYGVFYNGWYNYVLARKVILTPKSKRDPSELFKFRQKCNQIMTALRVSESPFLESYPGACWPADMTVAMGSIALGNKVFAGVYQQDLSNWIRSIESKTDLFGLIPHSSSIHGEVLEPSRGSSQSLILNFLHEIDSEYAVEKFKIYKENYLDHHLGLPGIREYPIGIVGNGDIDSGPVIWDIGGAASIVGQRVMAIYGEGDVAIGLRNSIEIFALGNIENERKSYLFGKLIIVDAFIAWSNSIEANESNKIIVNKNWRLKTQLISMAILVLGVIGISLMLKKNTDTL